MTSQGAKRPIADWFRLDLLKAARGYPRSLVSQKCSAFRGDSPLEPRAHGVFSLLVGNLPHCPTEVLLNGEGRQAKASVARQTKAHPEKSRTILPTEVVI